MTPSRNVFMILAAIVFCSLCSVANADDEFVKKAVSLKARDFDQLLPDQPIDGWLRSHIPQRYEVVWGEHVTDCGEGTGTAVDKERDMPICLEVVLKEGPKIRGYLALYVGTEKRGFLKDGCGLYFGYLEHGGDKYNFKRLSDVTKVK
jgi:hypothetical protein